MNRGKYNRYLTVKRPTEVKSGDFNEVTSSLVLVGNVWAHRSRTTAKEVRNGVDTEISMIIYELRDFDIDHNDIVEDKGVDYEVKTVSEKDEDHLIISVKLVKND